jgi:hypothetical protein
LKVQAKELPLLTFILFTGRREQDIANALESQDIAGPSSITAA